MKQILAIMETVKSINIKSILGASLFTFFGAITTYLFKDREASIHEMNEYERYVTEFLVLNEHPAKKRMLAQYFASVTPSNFQQKNWTSYFESVQKDYESFLFQDSLDRNRYKFLLDKEILTNSEKWEKEDIEKKLKNLNRQETTPIVTPNSKNGGNNSNTTIYIQYTEKSFDKAKTIKEYLNEQGFIVPDMEKKNDISENDIRFYYSENQEVVKNIVEKVREKQKITLKQKDFSKLNYKVKSNVLEIWLE